MKLISDSGEEVVEGRGEICSARRSLSMGALDEGHYSLEIGSGCLELGFEHEPETLAIEDAVRVLLQGLGEDINREGLRKTPLRVAKALREGTGGYRLKAKDIVHGALFPEAGLESGVGHAGGVGGLVIVRDLDFFSYCECCLLPFRVKCHVGYIPSGHRVVGLSKLSRVADTFAKRLQDPHRLADEVCTALQDGIKPAGVAVLLLCFHIHLPNFESSFLDVKHHGWTKILVTSGSGVFEDKTSDMWSDFLSLIKFQKGTLGDTHFSAPRDQLWCPSESPSKIVQPNSAMVTAVASIIQALGEDPSREKLVGTPSRFVTWLLNFKNCNLEVDLNELLGCQRDTAKLNGTVIPGEEHTCSEFNLSFWSQCEHHLLPFQGVVHVGYISGNGVNTIVRSTLQSIVHFYGFKLQVQERLTRQIAETVSSVVGEDVMVVVEAEHTCMISRGVEKFGSNTATVAVLGKYSIDSTLRAKFLRSIPNFCEWEG